MTGLQEKVRDISHQNKKSILILTALVIGVTAVLGVPEFSGNGNSQEFNRNDMMFMNMMIVHHDQAIEMAELAEERTDNEKILGLADNISEAQKRENRQMREWMENLGMRYGNHHPMAGMASQMEMQRLRNSNGSEFNELFAELMIRHHEGGIAMSQDFKASGQHGELKEMQQQMIEAQQREIEKMQNWQDQNLL